MLPALGSSLYPLSGFGRMLEDFFGETDKMLRVPGVNIKEDDKKITIELAAPGLEKEDFHVDVDQNVLTISAKRETCKGKDGKEGKCEKGGQYLHQEYCYQSFSRSFSLPDVVDASKIEAGYSNGVLAIELPKREPRAEEGGRRIAVK